MGLPQPPNHEVRLFSQLDQKLDSFDIVGIPETRARESKGPDRCCQIGNPFLAQRVSQQVGGSAHGIQNPFAVHPLHEVHRGLGIITRACQVADAQIVRLFLHLPAEFQLPGHGQGGAGKRHGPKDGRQEHAKHSDQHGRVGVGRQGSEVPRVHVDDLVGDNRGQLVRGLHPLDESRVDKDAAPGYRKCVHRAVFDDEEAVRVSGVSYRFEDPAADPVGVQLYLGVLDELEALPGLPPELAADADLFVLGKGVGKGHGENRRGAAHEQRHRGAGVEGSPHALNSIRGPRPGQYVGGLVTGSDRSSTQTLSPTLSQRERESEGGRDVVGAGRGLTRAPARRTGRRWGREDGVACRRCRRRTGKPPTSG